MFWQPVPISEQAGKSTPFVSIGRGQLTFNAAACDLVGDKGQYKYAMFLESKEKSKSIIGVGFLEDYQPNSIRIKRKQSNGKAVRGMTIAHKGAILKLFGKDGSNDGTVRRKVKPDPDAGNILIIVD